MNDRDRDRDPSPPTGPDISPTPRRSHGRRRSDRSSDRYVEWYKVIPRWIVIPALFATTSAAAWLFWDRETGRDAQLAAIAAAQAEAPTKYLARLSERVAITETQIGSLTKGLQDVVAGLEKLREGQSKQTQVTQEQVRATQDQTTTMDRLARELALARKGRQ